MMKETSQIVDKYNIARESCIKKGVDIELVENIALKIAVCQSEVQATSLYIEFEDIANQILWLQDHDVGALLLHKLIDEKRVSNLQIRKFMLMKAIERTKACLQAGTSGGECLARAEYLNELKGLLTDY